MALTTHWKYSGCTCTCLRCHPKAIHTFWIDFAMKSATLPDSKCSGSRGISRQAYDISYARLSNCAKRTFLGAWSASLAGLRRPDLDSGVPSESTRAANCVDGLELGGGTGLFSAWSRSDSSSLSNSVQIDLAVLRFRWAARHARCGSHQDLRHILPDRPVLALIPARLRPLPACRILRLAHYIAESAAARNAATLMR